MKLAFLYSERFLAGRPLIDMRDPWGSPRGLTGSEVSFLAYAREMGRRGHEVSAFFPHGGDFIDWEGVDLYAGPRLQGGGFDAAIAWIDPDLLRDVPQGTLRVLNQQCNDFAYAKPDFDRVVDVYTSPSEPHRDYLAKFTSDYGKWEILPNGCDLSEYTPRERVPGRVVYASSPDRGLHLLLQAWPEIRRRVPHATLRIFYDIDRWLESMARWSEEDFRRAPDLPELARRAEYVRDGLRRGKGIEKIGSVSRRRLAEEMSQAEVLAYPCDTIRFTEGFSVTTLEACAAGMEPVISAEDSLGHIYGDVATVVPSPVRLHLREFADAVVVALTTERSPQYDFAKRYEWPVLAERLEKMLERRLAEKRTIVDDGDVTHVFIRIQDEPYVPVCTGMTEPPGGWASLTERATTIETPAPAEPAPGDADMISVDGKIPKRIDGNDWGGAFAYAPFAREDVMCVIAAADGQNEGDNWVGVFLLKDGRYGYLTAGCDHSGWECQAEGHGDTRTSLHEVVRELCEDDDRRRLKLGLPDEAGTT